jgi:hypothetical protein
VAVRTTHPASALSGADVVIGTLRELPGVLADEFEAAAVLRTNDGH